ncbi:MAG: hypothetical protein Unbinned2903contig1001_42 [Prokaryotic dsDNA virus sp.]|nr:MAG: hypothetical protein Unbinned2903contig1001_42 [Prokaryotic dsDNA virus sp.]|tara:strand:+ start:12383 stop:12619 length:237 start_codon:yes stop_codon:yes gene_type:complete
MKSIKEYVKEYPNDKDLGAKIRENVEDLSKVAIDIVLDQDTIKEINEVNKDFLKLNIDKNLLSTSYGDDFKVQLYLKR